MLDALPDGSRVAILHLVGSLCPMTQGHLRVFEEARKVLLPGSPEHDMYAPRALEAFREVLGFVSLNADSHVQRKMESLGAQSLNYQNRRLLVEMSIEQHPWLKFLERQDPQAALSHAWPRLTFVRYSLNGADDVVKYRKWSMLGRRPHFTIGRHGYTEQVRKAMVDFNLTNHPNFVLGPELPDISSTKVRRLLADVTPATLDGTREQLCELLHPRVAAWCLEKGVFRSPRSLPAATLAAPSAAAAVAAKVWSRVGSVWPLWGLPPAAAAVAAVAWPGGTLRSQVAPLLDTLPDGSRVALLILQGSLCPMTQGHVRVFEEARKVLLPGTPEHDRYAPKALEDFREVLGFVILNSDSHVRRKMESLGAQSLNYQDRKLMVEMSIEQHPWLNLDEREDPQTALSLAWPHLKFVKYSLNGADDVVKYQKWLMADVRRHFTIGRPGFTEHVEKVMVDLNLINSPNFVLGPELPDISSTKVRRLLADVTPATWHSTREQLCELLHPRVALLCLENGVFRSRR